MRDAFTFSEAKRRCQENNCTLHFDRESRDYRVCLRGTSEKAAYYTDCIEDAVLTSGRMNNPRK